MTIPFDKTALDQPGPHLTAWDLSSDRGTNQLALFGLGSGGAQELAQAEVADADREAVEAALGSAEIPVGVYDRMCDFVWLERPQRFEVWSSKKRTFLADGGTLHPTRGEPLPAGQVRAVTSFVDEESAEVGVVLETDAGDRPVAVEISMTMLSDPFATSGEVTYEALWAMHLARSQAAWLKVPHRNRD